MNILQQKQQELKRKQRELDDEQDELMRCIYQMTALSGQAPMDSISMSMQERAANASVRSPESYPRNMPQGWRRNGGSW